MKFKKIKHHYILILLTIVLFVGFIDLKFPDKTNILFANENNTTDSSTPDESVKEPKDSLNVYFYNLNSTSSGDSFIITYNDVEILVDAGPAPSSASIITNAMKKHVSDDNIWDFVIATHADYDHIASFSTISNNGVFDLAANELDDSRIKIKNIIDFDFTQDDTVTIENKEQYFKSSNSPLAPFSGHYQRYRNKRNELINSPSFKTNYYPASKCCWNERGLSQKPDGAPDSNIFNLDSSGNVQLKILYNYFYDHRFNENSSIESYDKNLICVCFMIKYKVGNETKRLLFTGDLQETDSKEKITYGGESKLIEENQDEFNDGILFYKAGHHGSSTSNSMKLIDTIRPCYVVIPAVAFDNHGNPRRHVIERFFKYTDHIYMSSYLEEGTDGMIPFYGDIHFYIDNKGNPNVETSNDKITDSDGNIEQYMHDSKGNPIDIQDTNWFKENINASCSTYVFDTFVNEKSAYYSKCTLIKYGHYEILINCGTALNAKPSNNRSLIQKVKKYCTDGILECVVLTTFTKLTAYQQLADLKVGNDIYPGIMSSFKIENIIDTGENAKYKNLLAKKYQALESYHLLKQKQILNGAKYYPAIDNINKEINIAKNLSLKILNNVNYNSEYENDVCLLVNFYDQYSLFTGDITESTEKLLVKNNKNDLRKVNFYQLARFGFEKSNCKQLLSSLNHKELIAAVDSVANTTFWGDKIVTKQVYDRLHANSKEIYISLRMTNQALTEEVNGTIKYTIYYGKYDNRIWKCGSCRSYMTTNKLENGHCPNCFSSPTKIREEYSKENKLTDPIIYREVTGSNSSAKAKSF